MTEDSITHQVSSACPQMPLLRQEPAGSVSAEAARVAVQPRDMPP